MRSFKSLLVSWGAVLVVISTAQAALEDDPVVPPSAADAAAPPAVPAPAVAPEPDSTTATVPGSPAALPAVAPQSPTAATPDPVEKSDPAARMFSQKCAGCHTVGGGPLTGPDLKAVQAWPRQNLDPAILRMEKNVGKLKPEEVQTLGDLLLAPDAASRIADERKRIAMQEMAKLAPANAAIGEDLFFGRKPLSNRGLACASCHAVAGAGGNLAIDLTGSFGKLGQAPLMSTVEGATFPLMKAAYTNRAVTTQEALHLVKYLETAGAGKATPRSTPPLHALGFVGAAIALAGMSRHFRKRNRGVRARLVRDAVRRSRS